jgi:hypothetical protein
MRRFAFRAARTLQTLIAALLVAAVSTSAPAQAPQPQAQPRAAAAPAPAPVPAAVAIPRPSAAEVQLARDSFAKFLASADAATRTVVQKYPGLLDVRPPGPNTAILPALAPQFQAKHEANKAVAREGDAELLLMGDSITDFWRNMDGPFAGKPVLDKHFGQWKIANFGIAGDTT